METTCQFNKIFVIQSLRDGELQTGERLVQAELGPRIQALGLGLCYVKVADRASFMIAMDVIWKECAETTPRSYPILHLDAHGKTDKSGIAMLPSGETVTWGEFAAKCRCINVECHNNLLVASGLCFGLPSAAALH